ncbi:MAG TPA: DUF4314 domain-containing protein [Ruminococcus sp.]|nr:DUF4314 domain-containing protein [Ruminococcus sp.]
MMQFPNEEQLAELRRKYPKGTLIRLIRMDDPQAPPCGAVGEVECVDDIGDILMSWKGGGSLALIEGVDEFEILNTPGGEK